MQWIYIAQPLFWCNQSTNDVLPISLLKSGTTGNIIDTFFYATVFTMLFFMHNNLHSLYQHFLHLLQLLVIAHESKCNPNVMWSMPYKSQIFPLTLKKFTQISDQNNSFNFHLIWTLCDSITLRSELFVFLWKVLDIIIEIQGVRQNLIQEFLHLSQ